MTVASRVAGEKDKAVKKFKKTGAKIPGIVHKGIGSLMSRLDRSGVNRNKESIQNDRKRLN